MTVRRSDLLNIYLRACCVDAIDITNHAAKDTPIATTIVKDCEESIDALATLTFN